MKFKSINSGIYHHLVIVIVLFIFIILTFQQLPRTFYQQDEWLGSGQVLVLGLKIITKDNSILQVLFADGRPLSRALGALFFFLFPLQTVPLAIYSIVLHFINTLIIYIIIYKLVKRKFVSFLGASYFAVESISHQTITWFGASFGGQASSLLVFLSVLSFLFFLENKKIRYFYVAFITAIISLYFKETGIFLFPLFFIAPFIFNRKYSIRKMLISYIPIFIFGFIFSTYRLVEMILIRTPSQGTVYITSATQNIVPTLLVRSVLYPLTSLSLSFIPQPVATYLSENLWHLYYPYITQRPDLVFQTVVLDLISVILSFLLLVLLFFIARSKEYRKIIIFALVYFLLTIVPYIIIAKDYAYLEPRYYYLSLLYCGLVIAVIFSFLQDRLNGLGKIIFIIAIILYLGYLRYNIAVIRHDIAYQVDIATERRSYMKQLYLYLPTLKSNTNVFYFTGNRSWLVDGNKTPFQNGFGYTVMVLYYKSGKIPTYLPTSEYLWTLGSQGFKESNGLRYGYYNDFDSLKKSVSENSINLSDIHAFYYDWNKKKLLDITSETQQKIRESN